MFQNKAVLVCLYFVTLACVCGITIVGPAAGGSITNLALCAPNTSSGNVDISLAALSGGTRIVYSNVQRPSPLWNWAVGMWTDDTGLVKLLANVAASDAGELTIPFSFEAAGFADPTGIQLSLEGTSNGLEGLVGLFPVTGPTAATDPTKSCSDYELCLGFGDGPFSLGPVSLPYFGGGSFLVEGELYVFNPVTGYGTVFIGADSADIQLTDSAVPEPSSVLLLAGGLAVLAWLRRRILEV